VTAIDSRTGTDRWGLAGRHLYLCTPDRDDLEAFVGRCISGGVDVVQLREKHLDEAALVRRAVLVQRVCAAEGVPFVLNDRPDLAAAIGADGVHVGQDDASAVDARSVVGADAIVGLSTHASAELDVALGMVPDNVAAERGSGTAIGTPAPVDYLSAGPVVPTPTKPGRPGTGTGYLTEATTRSPWPVWVTGGVGPESIGRLVDAGARHFVVVRWLVEADDPAGAARVLRTAIDQALENASG
jgi:thiamine-phosphate pyrophosphorylase